MSMIRKGVVLLVLAAQMSTAAAQRDPQGDAPEEILVIGRQPGPPMWRVSNGSNELWIFASLSPIPKDMIWESARVEAVIAQSQEYLQQPSSGLSVPRTLLLNPANLVRGYRLAKRLSRNTDGATLDEVVAPELYGRFAELKARYFPDDDKIEEYRPMLAGDALVAHVQQQEGLVSAREVMKKIDRMVKRNRAMVRTETTVERQLEGNYRSLSRRIEEALDTIPPELESACLESRIASMESDVEEMKIRASSWAQGYVDDFRGIPPPRELHAACEDMLLVSEEAALIQQLQEDADSNWLSAAEVALSRNASTFAVLDIHKLLRPEGLLARLQGKGYEVRAP